MIANDAIQPFAVEAENRVPHHDLIVGAGLVPALGRMPAHNRATTRVAPTGCSYTGRYDPVLVATNLEGLVK